jgi:Xaa-Pro aminopeptidase
VKPDARERRLAAIRGAMSDSGYTALVVAGRGIISQYGFLEYVAGYCPVVRTAYAVLGHEGEPTLVVPTAADAWYAGRVAGLADVRVAGEGDVLSEFDDLPSGVAAALREREAVDRVGVVGLRHIVPAGDYEALRSALPGATLSDATGLVADIKAVKDEGEIEEMRRTAEIADEGFAACLPLLSAGASAWEAAAAVEQAVRLRGAREVLVFLSAGPYFLRRPDARPFRNGDLITAYVEITGPTGYWIELARLIALGGIDAKRADLAAATLGAAGDAAAELRVGRPAAAVARVIDQRAAQHDLRSGIWHGHGVGVDHDPPVVTAGDTTPLVERMVLALHPNFSTRDEAAGASVADTYVVRDGEPERLSSVPQELHRL